VILAIEEAIERGAIEEVDVTQERLKQFLSSIGRHFYTLSNAAKDKKIVLQRQRARVPSNVRSKNDKIEVVHSRTGDNILSLRWEIAR
jgi:dihydroorotase